MPSLPDFIVVQISLMTSFSASFLGLLFNTTIAVRISIFQHAQDKPCAY